LSEPRRGPILCFATQGSDDLDAERLSYLLQPAQAVLFPFDHDSKASSAIRLAKAVLAQRPSLIVMEGTGIAGGLVLLAANALLGTPFVVSSGDAVGPYLGLRSRAIGWAGGAYERLLCRRCAGFVGWTPYLVGRAITFGAPRGMTAPGWARKAPPTTRREEVRDRLGIAPEAHVVGLVGTLQWTPSVRYTYGAELAEAATRLTRDDVIVCIVGDGPGRERLEDIAGRHLGVRVLLPGRVAAAEVPDYLAAFDIASLSQSVDRVGSFRYTIKLSEYLAAGLPVITTQIPASYDLDEGYFWRLPGHAPWSPRYIDALTALLESLTTSDIEQRRAAVARRHRDIFDPVSQRRRMGEFVQDVLARAVLTP